MHICFITGEFPLPGQPHGGIGSFVANLGESLVKQGFKVSVIGLRKVKEAESININGIDVFSIPHGKSRYFKWYENFKSLNQKILEIHKNNKIDVIETAELGLAFLKKIPSIKYIIRMHGGHNYFAKFENRPVKKWMDIQERRSFARADYIVAVSDFVGYKTKELISYKKDYQVIYNPINSKKFYNATNENIEEFSILFAGSIIEKKGIRQLVQSMEYLVDKFPKVKLYVAGRFANIPGTSKSYEPILKAEISDKIKNHIEFLGVVPNTEMPKLISRMHICCYPSHMEAMPIAWLEVLAMGKIFIGSSTGPGPEAVLDNKTGLLCNPHDPKDIADKITWVFQNTSTAKQFGDNARQYVIENFDNEVIISKNIDFYTSIIK